MGYFQCLWLQINQKFFWGIIQLFTYILLPTLLVSCGTSASDSSTPTPTPVPTFIPISTPTPTSTLVPIISDIRISGQLSYDFVPHFSSGIGLNYEATEERPIRGVDVQLLNTLDNVVAQTQASDNGFYQFAVEENTDYRIRVLAQWQENDTAIFDFKVTDNTSNNALYVLDGSLVASGTSSSTRDLHASSGWGGNSYINTRSAAPFAILDSVYEVMDNVLAADSTIHFPAAEFRWSINNNTRSGNLSDGNIGTSFYTSGEYIMYILGDENNDTDEYDVSVIQHEFGHFLEDVISRSDSIGGAHSTRIAHDMRLAFSEGFANALTALASATGVYQDSLEDRQAGGFSFSIENIRNNSRLGWFNEGSVGNIIYDLVDEEEDTGDTLNLDFATVYNVLSSAAYVDSTALTSIYSFVDILRDNVDPAQLLAIDILLSEHNIHGQGIYGESETNDGGFASSLPVYQVLDVGSVVTVCTDNEFGEYNLLDNRRFLRFSLTSSQVYTIDITTNSASTGNKNPAGIVTSKGNFVTFLSSSNSNSETSTLLLDSGDYVLEVYDVLNIDSNTNTGGNACFDVTIN